MIKSITLNISVSACMHINYCIPIAGTMVAFNIYALHHNAAVWGDDVEVCVVLKLEIITRFFSGVWM